MERPDAGDGVAEGEAFALLEDALLDALWDAAPLGLAYFDTRLRYRRVNSAVLDIYGGTADERLGRTVEDVHGPVGAQIAEGMREVLADGTPRLDVPVRGRLWHGRGPLREWRMHYYPVRGRCGEIVGVGVVMVEITESERNRRDLAEVAAEREHVLGRYQSLVEATSAAVWIRAPDGSAVADAPRLRAITGQSENEHRGWGFLDAVHPAHRATLGDAWRAAATATPSPVFTHVYRLRTTSGYRWFRTRAVPVLSEGQVVEWVGTETDIDDAIRARGRLAVLAGATFAMQAALDPEAELAALAGAVVPDFADLCRVYLLDPAPLRTTTVGITGRRSATCTAEGILRSPASDERFMFGPDHPIAECARTAAPVLIDATVRPVPWRGTEEMERWGEEISAHSVLIAPVVARGDVVAALLFLACGDRPRYTEDDLALVTELAQRASAAVDTAVTFQRSREVSVALESAMLSEPPARAGVEIEARYLPAAAGLRVGGDWYDAFRLPGGDLAVGVGDVAGHDVSAAATMGQLRSMLRGLAYDSDAAPSEVLRRLDRVACGLTVTRFTTLVFGRLSADGMFRWSSAGHPAPLLIEPGQRARFLQGPVDVVLGVDPGRLRHDGEVRLAAGATLLLYTDGLVERRDDLDDGARPSLIELVTAASGMPLADFCDHVVHGSAADTCDDIAVLAVRTKGDA